MRASQCGTKQPSSMTKPRTLSKHWSFTSKQEKYSLIRCLISSKETQLKSIWFKNYLTIWWEKLMDSPKTPSLPTISIEFSRITGMLQRLQWLLPQPNKKTDSTRRHIKFWCRAIKTSKRQMSPFLSNYKRNCRFFTHIWSSTALSASLISLSKQPYSGTRFPRIFCSFLKVRETFSQNVSMLPWELILKVWPILGQLLPSGLSTRDK